MALAGEGTVVNAKEIFGACPSWRHSFKYVEGTKDMAPAGGVGVVAQAA